jgi:hypothetical protein
MTATRHAPTPTVLTPDGGFVVPVNCPACGDGLTVEGASRGREDIVGPCHEVRVVLFCAHCKDRYMLSVSLDIATRQRTPEKRWTGKANR